MQSDLPKGCDAVDHYKASFEWLFARQIKESIIPPPQIAAAFTAVSVEKKQKKSKNCLVNTSFDKLFNSV